MAEPFAIHTPLLSNLSLHSNCTLLDKVYLIGSLCFPVPKMKFRTLRGMGVVSAAYGLSQKLNSYVS